MTDWNSDNPYDLGVWDQLKWTPPPVPDPSGFCNIRLPIPHDFEEKPKPEKCGIKRPNSHDSQDELSQKQSKLSLSLKGKKEKSRFVSPKKNLESYQKAFVPKNTEVNTSWAKRNFQEWSRAYNERHPESPCPDDLLLTDNAEDLSFWLQKYVLETRKRNGEQYPPKTIYLLLCGLNRYMREKKSDSLNIFDYDNPSFKQLRTTCDSLFRELREEGVGNSSKSTEPITKEDEEILWSSGQLDPSTPKGLLNAVFFLNGKKFHFARW